MPLFDPLPDFPEVPLPDFPDDHEGLHPGLHLSSLVVSSLVSVLGAGGTGSFGSGVGFCVGLRVTGSPPNCVGEAVVVGASVGVSVGSVVGLKVGATVGVRLGSNVGSRVGNCAQRKRVSLSLCGEVGSLSKQVILTMVGAIVGDSVGPSDGVRVGKS